MRLAAVVGLAALSLFAIVSDAAAEEVPASGRAWELMTLAPVSSSKVLGVRPMANDSNRVVGSTIGPPPESASGSILNFRTLRRAPDGWLGSPLGLPYTAEATTVIPLFAPLEPIGFSTDEETVLWLSATPLTPGAPPQEAMSLYRTVHGGPPEYIDHINEGAIIFASLFEYLNFADISSNGDRVDFSSAEHLLPNDAARTEGESIYTWAGQAVEQVDVDNGGTMISKCGVSISHYSGMSSDGSHVFFSTPASCEGGEKEEKVYMRDLSTKHTTEISASQCTRGDCNALANVEFAGATPDGKVAYLTTTQQLTNADTDETRDLYRYDVASGELTLLSGAPSAVTGEVNRGRVFPSEDGGSHVYFRATGEMLPGEAGAGEKLFVFDGTGMHLVGEAAFPPIFNETASGLWPTPVELSADGSRALFLTQSPVLPSDTDGANDAYLYDANSETVTEISQSPIGGNGPFPVSTEPPTPANDHEYELWNTVRPYWAIDAAGDRVFFQTQEALLPEDINGQFDVYEWHEGKLGMISPGYQPLESTFGGISRDGQSALIATNARILPADMDGDGRDFYDARIGGGFPEPPAPPECTPATCPLPASQRITRSDPISLGAAGKGKRGQLRVLEVASRPKGNTLAVVVSAPAAGTVSASVWVQEGKKKVVLARGSGRAAHAGKVELALRLTAAGKKAKGTKNAHLTVSAGTSKAAETVRVKFQ